MSSVREYCKFSTSVHQIFFRFDIRNKGPFVNYVSVFFPIFDQVSTLSKYVY